MQDVLKLQQKIVPEMIELLQKRYNILRTIYYNQPVGRRMLASDMGVGERIVRTEVNFLKDQNLINVSTPGMYITAEGEELLEKLKDFIHELRGLSEIEFILEKRLGLKKVIIVPGDIEENKIISSELGRVASIYLKSILIEGSIIALTGGSTIKEVVDSFTKITTVQNVLIVPARGGMGRNVEVQANTLVANLANKIGANYKLLHVPDNLSNNALSTILNEKDIREVIDTIHSSDILIYGIGRAEEMGRRRGLTSEEIDNLIEQGAVGEAFGCYFNRKGEFLYSTPTIGVGREDIKKIKNLIAVAGGRNKAEAIIAIEINSNGTLITDEGAAREILKITHSK